MAKDPGYSLECDGEHGEIRLTFGGTTYTLAGVPTFGTLRKLHEGADSIRRRIAEARANGDPNANDDEFAVMVEILEWWRGAAASLGVELPPVDELPLGLALQGPAQQALTHWLVCSVPTRAPGESGGSRNGRKAPAKSR